MLPLSTQAACLKATRGPSDSRGPAVPPPRPPPLDAHPTSDACRGTVLGGVPTPSPSPRRTQRRHPLPPRAHAHPCARARSDDTPTTHLDAGDVAVHLWWCQLLLELAVGLHVGFEFFLCAPTDRRAEGQEGRAGGRGTSRSRGRKGRGEGTGGRGPCVLSLGKGAGR